MNVLLVNPKSPRSFWTFDHTARRLGRRALNPPLGLLTVAALLPPEWEVRLLDKAFQVTDEDLWRWAQVVMVSGMMVQREDMIATIGEAKSRAKTVVVGGPYPSLIPEELVRAGADHVARGEAEAVVPLIVPYLLCGEGPRIVEEPFKPDLKRSPAPRFDLLDTDAYVVMSIQTSRGCPFQCEFCDIAALYGKKARQKTPDQVIGELESLYSLGWRSGVFISDDNFIGRKTGARAILRAMIPWMKAHGNPYEFWTQASVDLGEDRESIDLMTEANFSHVFLGIETPDEKSLARSGKSQNVRTPLLQAVRNINANGLSIVGSFILGFDGEERGAGDRICAFVEEAAIPIVLINALQAVPHTALWNRLREEGRLIEDREGALQTGEIMNFHPTRPEEEIRREILEATLHLYEPSGYLRRTRDFYLTMWPTRKALGQVSQPSAQHVTAPQNQPTRRVFQDAKLALGLFWQHGFVAAHRWQFWRQLIDVARTNPSRVAQYLAAIDVGGDIFRLRKVIRERLERSSRGSAPNQS